MFGAPSIGSEVPSDRDLRSLIVKAISPQVGLTPLPGFKLDLSANPDFRKVFFKASCECGTSALLSVEVGGDKTVDQITDALPLLVDRLERQAGVFSKMTCDAHQRLRLGPAVQK
ncbi:MAG: hypothetical protein O3A47_07390 [Chloroflexi bacterium]|nr:hypothetical protein [Chloroflexota bacterium]